MMYLGCTESPGLDVCGRMESTKFDNVRPPMTEENTWVTSQTVGAIALENQHILLTLVPDVLSRARRRDAVVQRVQAFHFWWLQQKKLHISSFFSQQYSTNISKNIFVKFSKKVSA